MYTELRVTQPLSQSSAEALPPYSYIIPLSNSRPFTLSTPVNRLLSTFLPNSLFSPIITREFRPPKPHPAGILHIAERWDLENRADDLIMVGDSVDDMTAGFRAGAATVLLVNEVNAHLATHEHTDLCIRR